jgi:FKBP-type peptidyl-prolyl cis-trans isomerase 2
MSNKVKGGDAVTFNYEGRIEDGSAFHTLDEDPITVEVGAGSLIKGLEEQLIGMSEGEEKEITVSPENGYGMEKSELVQTVDSSLFAETEITPEIGMIFKTPHGNCHITGMEGDKIEISFNHPLAGKVLDYKIKVIKIVSK